MKKILLIFIGLFFLINGYSQSKKTNITYKKMMEDSSINFYTVCDSAEAYFKTIDRTIKGSGYKPFLRWKHQNESKFYPSGDRMVDYYMPYKEFEKFKKENKKNRLQNAASNTDWQTLGPGLIGTITGHYAPGLGRIEYVEVNKNNPQQIYMGSRSGGLWRTNNEGVTWSHGTDFLPASGVDAIAASPTNFNQVLINVRMADNGNSFGIYKSIDGGATFTQTAFNPTNVGYGGLGSNFKIFAIKYHPTIPNLVFIGTSQGLYRSTDNLTTTSWTRQINGGDVYDIDFHPSNPNIIYIYDGYFTPNKILKSTDIGITYTGLTDLPGNAGEKIKISTVTSSPDVVFASSDNGIWNSTNQGTTFTTIQNPAPAGVALWQALPNNLDPNYIVCGYVDLFRSTDAGANFTKATWWSLGSAEHGGATNQASFNNSNVYVHADCDYMANVNGVFYACTDGFLSKSSDNGLTWTRLNSDTTVRENYNLGISQSNDERLICGAQDNGTCILSENGWIEFYGADGMEGIIHPLNDDWMIGSTQYGGRRKTTDGGLASNGAAPPGQNGYWVAPMFYDPNNQMTVYSIGVNVHKSTDFGATWTQLAAPSTFAGSTIQYGTIAENNSNKIVVTTSEKIELSTDGGVTFNSIKNNLPNLSISDVVFDPKNDNTIIVTYDGYQNNAQKIFISTNSGASWQNITYNLGNMPILSVVVENSTTSTIYVGAEIGIYKKAMTDTSWVLFNAALPNVSILEMEINSGSNTIYAASWGRGIWSNKLAGKENYPAIVKTEITNPPTLLTPKTAIPQYVTSQIDYVGVLSNVKVAWAINTPTFNATDIIPMFLVSGNIWKTNAPLPDFPVGTKVFFKVIATGSTNDTSETYKFMYEVRADTGICTASGENTNGSLRINSFSCAGYTNTSNAYGGYTYYNPTTMVLNKTNAYTATGTFNTSWSTNDFTVWIDYNNDGSFSLDERVVNDLDTGASGQGNFTVPITAKNGFVRMRVRLGYWADPVDPCGTTLGEVEDYLVQITGYNGPNITINSDAVYCLNTNVNLTYTGDTVDEITWTLQSNNKVYTYTGTSVNTSVLPSGIYSVVVSVKINNMYYHFVFSNQFEVRENTTWNGSVWSNGIPDGKAATFNANYTISTNLNLCSIQVANNATVTIQTGKTLNVENTVVVQSGSTLIVENDAALKQVNNVTNTGNIIVKRSSTPIRLLDYTAWSSPVFGQQLQAFSPNTLPNRFYQYLFTGTTTPTAYQSVVATTNFIKGKGYMIRAASNWPASPTVFNGQFLGVPNNGLVTSSIGIGYNLIGNPYPSPVSGNDLLTSNANVNTLYFWTHSVPQNGSYQAQTNFASYTLLGGTAAIAGGIIPNGKIEIGQGFYVKATTAGNFNIRNANRIAAAADVSFFKLNNVVDRFWINLKGNSINYNQILIGYTPNSSLNFDSNIDGKLIELDKTTLYSYQDNESYVIQGRGEFNPNDEVPLGINVLETGNYKLSLDSFEGQFLNTDIYIKDNLLNIYHNLKTSDYNFTIDVNTTNNRFEIVYKSPISVEDELVIIYPNPSDENSVIKLLGIESKGMYTIFDSVGKLIVTSEYKNGEIHLKGMASGVYLLKLQTETKTIDKKLLIK